MSFASQNTGPELRSVIRIKRKRLWVKRIVILEGGFLYYYKSSKDTKPRGILPLSSYSIKDLGLQKGEYLVELISTNQTPFALAFPTQNEGLAWLDAMKSAKNEQKSLRTPDGNRSEIYGPRSVLSEKFRKQVTIEEMPPTLSQKIRPILTKRYLLTGQKGQAAYYQEIDESVVVPDFDPMGALLHFSGLLMVVAFLVFGSDSTVFRALVLVTTSIYAFGRRFPKTKTDSREVAFKCSATARVRVEAVLNILQDVSGRGLWDPYCKEATDGDGLTLSYVMTPGRSFKQMITRNVYKDKSSFYLLEWESQKIKYLFVLEEINNEMEVCTRVSMFGVASEPFSPQTANPDLLSCLMIYLASSPSEAVSLSSTHLETGDLDQTSGDEDDMIGPGPLQQSVCEPFEGITRYEAEATEALSVFKQLLDDPNGWEPISTGSASVKGSRRSAAGGLYIIKGEGQVPQTVTEVVSYLKDLSRKGEYDTMFETGQILEKFSDELEVVYQKYKKQFPASGRDLCLVQRRFTLSEGKVFAVAMSTTHPDCLVNKDLVRAHLFIGGFALTPLSPSGTNIVYMTHADLGGKLPTMIVNKVQNSQALVVDGIRKALAK